MALEDDLVHYQYYPQQTIRTDDFGYFKQNGGRAF